MRLSNGMGNQMFMYASGYAFSKKLDREFFIDNETAFESSKNISRYSLSEFNFTAKIAPRSLKFLNVSGYLKRKIIKGNIIDLGAWIGDNAIPWAKNINHIVYAIDPSSQNIEFITKMCFSVFQGL